MKNVLIFYGPETYLSKKKVEELIKSYKEKLGDYNLSILLEEALPSAIITEIKTMPFLAAKRLVVARSIFTNFAKNKANEKELEKLVEELNNCPETAVVIIYEEAKPKSKAFDKLLTLPNVKAELAGKIVGVKLSQWVESEVTKRGGEIDKYATSLLLSETGSDLFKISGEIEKLLAYNLKITSESISLLVKGTLFSNIFIMVDAMGLRDYKKAMTELSYLINGGENEMYILTMMVRQFKNILMVKDLSAKGFSSIEIEKQTGLQGFVVRNTLRQAASFSFTELKEIYGKLLDIEYGIKKGESPALLLDLFTVGLKR
ncbi:MAG: polymerase III, delta subunit protein [candidate division CPR2 bacterium GW2011_GWC1_39_9]|uniref:DNA polymerase III subunit delta n=1 Tax=candidate division CPR2 bacterium GW2011_GWC2_39_10 TaxID=1618345 RepID=A0A0G0P566_UNCC2|nr:MAG: polymerase III, delta subunit protein [candidate division CPR2 bacterium GW2011_GWC2_39_10]KKR35947.1 MAG: polymerase III, delta subunit protein [candidate division CPR2 bacterium GW2011_GWC1_39_9]